MAPLSYTQRPGDIAVMRSQIGAVVSCKMSEEGGIYRDTEGAGLHSLQRLS